MMSWESDVLSTDEGEQFWQRMMDFEHVPLVSDFQRLTDAGIQLPDPDTMNDEQLTAKLWEMIHGLASMRVFLSETDHLSDRQQTVVLSRLQGAANHVSLRGQPEGRSNQSSSTAPTRTTFSVATGVSHADRGERSRRLKTILGCPRCPWLEPPPCIVAHLGPGLGAPPAARQ